MILRPFYEPYLGQSSYLLGCPASGVAVVVDPNRRIADYLESAAHEGLRITDVFETHIHADFVSGARTLAHRTGARLHVSALGDYEFVTRRGVLALHDGDTVCTGSLRLQAVHTPGHTPEHFALVVTDLAERTEPAGVLSGAAASLPQWRDLPLWPTHGPDGLDGDADRPRYAEDVRRLNRLGVLDGRAHRQLHATAGTDIARLTAACALFIDIRPDAAATGYLPGSVVAKLNRFFLPHVGSAVRFGLPFRVVSHDASEAEEANEALTLIGMDGGRGWISPSAFAAYRSRGGTLETLRRITKEQLSERIDAGAMLIDVRTTPEWTNGHIPHSIHMPLTHMVDEVRGLDRDTPLIVYGWREVRAAVGATALRRLGFPRVECLAGGYAAYAADTRQHHDQIPKPNLQVPKEIPTPNAQASRHIASGR